MTNKEAQPTKGSSPFKDELIPSDVNRGGLAARFKEVGSRKDKIIRQVPLEIVGQVFKSQDSLAAVAQAKQLFDELRGDYALNIPADIVIGPNPSGEEVAYILTDRVEGVDLFRGEGADERRERAISEWGHLYESLARYFYDKLQSREYLTLDIFKNEQYRYGHKLNTTEDGLYLIDTDIHYASQNSLLDMAQSLHHLLRSIDYKEQDLGVRFMSARRWLQDKIYIYLKAELEKDIVAVDQDSEIRRHFYGRMIKAIENFFAEDQAKSSFINLDNSGSEIK